MNGIRLTAFSVLLITATVSALATTWLPVFPFAQKTERGQVLVKSYPYETDKGPFGKGETFIYSENRLEYVIDKYISASIFTIQNGRYLIEYDFQSKVPWQFKGDRDAVIIYELGTLKHIVKVSTLEITPVQLEPWEHHDLELWKYECSENEKDPLKLKMAEHSSFIQNDQLCLITRDNQLITINIESGEIVKREANAYETLKKRLIWNPITPKKEFHRTNYPSRLPTLKNGQTVQLGLIAHFGADLLDQKDSISVFIQSLLIDINGQCEDAVVHNSLFTYLDPVMKVRIKDWLLKQRFQTGTIPKGFRKFAFSGKVLLK